MDKAKLIAAYQLWISRAKANPENYSWDFNAEACADYLLELLAEVESSAAVSA